MLWITFIFGGHKLWNSALGGNCRRYVHCPILFRSYPRNISPIRSSQAIFFFLPFFSLVTLACKTFIFNSHPFIYFILPPPLSLRTLATPLFVQQTSGSQVRASQGNLERGLQFAVESERWHRDLESRGPPLPNKDAATQAGKIPLIPDKQVSLAVSGRFSFL